MYFNFICIYEGSDTLQFGDVSLLFCYIYCYCVIVCLYLVSSKSVSNDRIFVSHRLEKLLETVCNLSD